ncbi:MAG TPA: spore coat U domain-containing protein [Gallionellaceae bacterium]
MKLGTPTRLASLITLALLTSVPATFAATDTATFHVTATVDPVCTVSSGGDLEFGMYAGSRLDATTTVKVTCTLGEPYTVALNNGLHFDGTHRRMEKIAASDHLQYDLYSDAGRTTAWNTTSTVPGTGTGLVQSLDVYGRIPGGQILPLGDYSDTITVTVNYI